MPNKQALVGFILLAFLVITSFFLLSSTELFIRFLIGLGFGYALARASMGFAGGVNRLSRVGSAQLASALLGMFVLTSIFTSFVLYGNEELYKLNIYPINTGLIIGGLMFGFGMALSSCCATGSLTDLAAGFSRASVTIFFFGIGVFLGFSYQGTASWIRSSWITSATGASSKGGVFLPDLFLFDGFHGYLGAIIITSLFAYTVYLLAKGYEKKLDMMPKQQTPEKLKLFSYKTLLINPWSMKVSSVIIALLFVSLLLVSHKGWSATSAFGLWFAKILMLGGLEAQSLSDYTTRSVDFFTQPLLEYGTSLQNVGIILGTVIALLLAGTFSQKFISGLKITPKAFFIFAFGGFIMGFGTRLSNGCNVGALFTPIAEFSLSGWLYLVFVVTGGFAGNAFIKRFISKSCSF